MWMSWQRAFVSALRKGSFQSLCFSNFVLVVVKLPCLEQVLWTVVLFCFIRSSWNGSIDKEQEVMWLIASMRFFRRDQGGWWLCQNWSLCWLLSWDLIHGCRALFPNDDHNLIIWASRYSNQVNYAMLSISILQEVMFLLICDCPPPQIKHNNQHSSASDWPAVQIRGHFSAPPPEVDTSM